LALSVIRDDLENFKRLVLLKSNQNIHFLVFLIRLNNQRFHLSLHAGVGEDIFAHRFHIFNVRVVHKQASVGQQLSLKHAFFYLAIKLLTRNVVEIYLPV
jgi:hypothetical protein